MACCKIDVSPPPLFNDNNMGSFHVYWLVFLPLTSLRSSLKYTFLNSLEDCETLGNTRTAVKTEFQHFKNKTIMKIRMLKDIGSSNWFVWMVLKRTGCFKKQITRGFTSSWEQPSWQQAS